MLRSLIRADDPEEYWVLGGCAQAVLPHGAHKDGTKPSTDKRRCNVKVMKKRTQDSIVTY